MGAPCGHVSSHLLLEMAAGWTSAETQALIAIWGEEEIQNALDGVVRNKTIYLKVARAMDELGHAKTWQQCRTKVKNLVQKYRKVSAPQDKR